MTALTTHREIEAQTTVDTRVGVQRLTTYCEPPFRELSPAQMLRRLLGGSGKHVYSGKVSLSPADLTPPPWLLPGTHTST